jgi:hypothetical protein
VGTAYLFFIFGHFAFAAAHQPICEEAGAFGLGCEAVPEGAFAGASLLQSGKATATLGQPSVAAEEHASIRAGGSSEEHRSVPLPSLSLLQAYSSGTGTRSFTDKRHRPKHMKLISLAKLANHRKRESLGPVLPRASMLKLNTGPHASLHAASLHPHSTASLQSTQMRLDEMQRSTAQSSIFYLVPMGVSLIACCIILSLVYCVVSGERAEDERLSRILGHQVSSGAGKPAVENPKVHVQARKVQKINMPEETESTSASGASGGSSSGSSVSTNASDAAAARESSVSTNASDDSAAEATTNAKETTAAVNAASTEAEDKAE